MNDDLSFVLASLADMDLAPEGSGAVFAPEDAVEHSRQGARALEIFEGTPRLNAWMYSKLLAAVRGDVLEIGSGIGNLSELIARDADRVVLTDMEIPYLDILRRRFPDRDRVVVARFHLDEAPPPEVASRRFDAIVAVNVLEHVGDDLGAVNRLAPLLKPGGKLLVYVPGCPVAYGELDRALGHHRRYTARSLAALMRSAGLAPDSPRYMNPLGLLGWIVNGRLLRRRAIAPRQVALFERLVPVLRIEDRFRLPFGLGLVVHASRPTGDQTAAPPAAPPSPPFSQPSGP